MPLCDVGEGIKIFYRTYGGGPVKVLLIIGFAGTHNGWLPQIKCLAGTDRPNDGGDTSVVHTAAGVEVCSFDNRGMGLSSIPSKKSQYTTRRMAKDAIALVDHLGWAKVNVFGHSMGAMIACKVASMVPERVLSLALLNVTGGGYQCIPKIGSGTFYLAMRFLRARTAEQRAAVDLDAHYSQEYLEERIGNTTRRSALYHEYVKNIKATGMQSNHGFEGQIHACWNHVMTRTEIEIIRVGGFPISVIHGRDDVIAQLRHARRLAEKLYPSARMVEFAGGHQLMHERAEEVNEALVDLIKASKCISSLYDWTNTPNKSSGSEASDIIIRRTSSSYFITGSLDKLQILIAYFFSLFALAFSNIPGVTKRINPTRVAPALT